MKRTWEGSKLTLDLEDGYAPVVVDYNDFPPNIQGDYAKFGMGTKLRNFTASKDFHDGSARKALTEGIKQLLAGNWGVERAGAVELTEAEKQSVVENYIVAQKRLKGDPRTETEIVAAWRAVPAEQRQKVVESKGHASALKKAMALRLKAKKGGGADIDV
jgi:hypothetical protein